MNLQSPIRIVVAGASGYIGQALIPRLLQKYNDAEIFALARTPQQSVDPRVQWRSCDLFSFRSIHAALPEKIDLAFYLVHSMGPTAQLDQGSFADYDLILSDNFARVLKARGVAHLIYLGGLIPDSEHLSAHLQSRLEVEQTFMEYNLPLTVFRAGLILGPGGSSFQILLKLVTRLTVMICPHWTQTLTTPVDLETVIASLVAVALEGRHKYKTYDLAGCAALTYVEMMQQTAEKIGRRRFFFTVPFFTPTLSRLWVCLITNTPKDLVYPLIESLEHPMVARSDHLFLPGSLEKTYADLLREVSTESQARPSIFRFRPTGKSVRSVQRLLLPARADAEWVKDQYITWLPKFLAPLIRVKNTSGATCFSLFFDSWVLLRLRFSFERSSADRQLLYIEGGLLSAKGDQGRLEFRTVLHRQFVLAAIHDYRPALPWFIYIFTQAKVHLAVMRAFSRHLRRIGGRRESLASQQLT